MKNFILKTTSKYGNYFKVVVDGVCIGDVHVNRMGIQFFDYKCEWVNHRKNERGITRTIGGYDNTQTTLKTQKKHIRAALWKFLPERERIVAEHEGKEPIKIIAKYETCTITEHAWSVEEKDRILAKASGYEWIKILNE
jgi:hypothetical protein